MLASSEETFEEAGASSAAQTFGPLLYVKNDVCVCVLLGEVRMTKECFTLMGV